MGHTQLTQDSGQRVWGAARHSSVQSAGYTLVSVRDLVSVVFCTPQCQRIGGARRSGASRRRPLPEEGWAPAAHGTRSCGTSGLPTPMTETFPTGPPTNQPTPLPVRRPKLPVRRSKTTIKNRPEAARALREQGHALARAGTLSLHPPEPPRLTAGVTL